MISFTWPWVFLLLPLPVVIYYLIPKIESQDVALKVPFLSRIVVNEDKHGNSSINYKYIRLICISIAWVLLIISTARPQHFGDAVALPTSGRDLMLAVDISGSMSTADMLVQDRQIPRLAIVKYILGEFLDKRKGDRVGLILFGTNAYLQTPLTFDLTTVNQFLQEATLRLAGEQTAIGDAIGLAVKRLKDRPAEQRILILLTDGENTAGNVMPRQAADLAKQAGVKIYTIGIGSDHMTVSSGLFGAFSRTVNPSSELDESTLEYIAEQTGGLYFRAHDPQELQQIYAKLDELEPIEQDEEFYRPVRSLFFYPLAICLFFSLLAQLIMLMPAQSLRGDGHA